ncbi:FAR1 DNA-binding domain protein [Medicago truncatula]|uniref:FAR1 DNA-binding domain protein n=1 Tax=Medicago truncatula TaxID=3880 RepID=G7IVX7_MEDTR|nr:FAR1 DNA-binding domain protein [Medicago truncatula]
MVENAGDRKPSVVEIKPPKHEVSVKVAVSVKVEATSVNAGVWKLRDNEVDTTHFFSSRETWKDKDELIGWVRRQANKAGFTITIKRSCAVSNHILELVCESSGEQKVSKKKVKHEATRSRKYECLFKVRGYVVREDNAWKLAILYGVHNHEMVPFLAGHLLAGRLMEDDKKIIHDLTNSSVKPKNILTNLKKKRQESMTNIKGDLTEMQFLISKTVLIMDSTYKTNLYKMPLFLIVGVTSTYLTY